MGSRHSTATDRHSAVRGARRAKEQQISGSAPKANGTKVARKSASGQMSSGSTSPLAPGKCTEQDEAARRQHQRATFGASDKLISSLAGGMLRSTAGFDQRRVRSTSSTASKAPISSSRCLESPSASATVPKTATTGQQRRSLGAQLDDNGDVFIYPPSYKRDNECQKCARDNKICNCIEIELANSLQSRASSRHLALDSERMSSVEERVEAGTANTITMTAAAIPRLQQAADRSDKTTQRSKSDQQIKTVSSASNNSSTSSECDLDNQSQVSDTMLRRQNQVKRVYKVSIATAVIDQESNKVELLAPRLISGASYSSAANSRPSTAVAVNLKGAGVEPATGTYRLERARAKSVPSGAAQQPQLDNGNQGDRALGAIAESQQEQSCSTGDLAVPTISKQTSASGPAEPVASIAIGTLAASHESLEQMARAAPKVEAEECEQLTCKLTLGDAIKVSLPSSSLAHGQRADNEAAAISTMADFSTSSRRHRKLYGLSRQTLLDLDETLANGVPTSTVLAPHSQHTIKMEDEPASKLMDPLNYSLLMASVRGYMGAERSLELAHKNFASNKPNAELVSHPLTETTTIMESHPECLLESHKRSIFDGASKDEILEYLEDARERVPELLIAADEVMVISENELILVNQLEPNSPATPISIMDPNEASENAAAKVKSDQIKERETANQGQIELQQQAQQQVPVSSAEAALSFLEEQSSLKALDSLDSAAFGLSSSIDRESALGSPSALELLTGFGHQFSSCSATQDSIDSQQFEGADELATAPGQMFALSNQTANNSDSLAQSSSWSSAEVNLRRLLEPTISSSSEQSGAGRDEASPANLMHISERVTSMLRHSSRRRKSQSECSASRTRPSTFPAQELKLEGLGDEGGKHHAERLKMLHEQRHSAAAALQESSFTSSSSSGSSSSSRSSSSPASSNSSASSPLQTSGNCSATSNLFYASPSLSCSSPFLTQLMAAGSPTTQQPAIVCTAPTNFSSSNTMCLSVAPADAASKPANYSSSLAELETARDDSALGTDFSSALSPPPPLPAPVPAVSGRLSVISEQQQTLPPSKCDQNGRNGSQFLHHKAPLLKASGGSAHNRLSLLQANRALHNSHYATINRLNNYLINRQALDGESPMIEFQCLDCDQFIVTEQARILHKANELRLLRENEISSLGGSAPAQQHVADSRAGAADERALTDQIERAYVAALNVLPLCGGCEKRRQERKEIIAEFVDTERKYGRDLKIVHDEFYRPLQVAGLLTKDQINAIFLNLDELIMAHCRFLERLEMALSEAQAIGDSHYNSVHIGRLFVESADMLHAFESYCIRQGSAACQLARLAKERELLRIFLRVSQMENTLLRRMNLAAFLMVPVQRVTKYPLLLARLHKVTAYHHKDREALRDAQLKVELHLEHINQQTKGVSATNKIWRRISMLSAPSMSSSSASLHLASAGHAHHNGPHHKRPLISAEEIGYIKLRKSAMELLKWHRDETQFIHSGRLHFAPLNEFLVKQKSKSIRYMGAHALLIVLGKPNWKYRPDLVKSQHDARLLVPTPGGSGVKEAALLLFREKNGRFVAWREPIFLSNCILSNDCSLFNSELPHSHPATSGAQQQQQLGAPSVSASKTSVVSNFSSSSKSIETGGPEWRPASAELAHRSNSDRAAPTPTKRLEAAHSSSAGTRHHNAASHDSASARSSTGLLVLTSDQQQQQQADSVSVSSLSSLPEEQRALSSPPAQSARSYSLASALPRTAITSASLTMAAGSTRSSSLTAAKTSSNAPVAPTNGTILNQLMSRVNNYHQSRQSNGEQQQQSGKLANASSKTPVELNQRQSSRANSNSISDLSASGGQSASAGASQAVDSSSNSTTSYYQHHFFHNPHTQPYGDHEESFELHERLTKESLLLRADTPLKTRYWLQMLRYHAKDLGQWRWRRQALANIMMMRQE